MNNVLLFKNVLHTCFGRQVPGVEIGYVKRLTFFPAHMTRLRQRGGGSGRRRCCGGGGGLWRRKNKMFLGVRCVLSVRRWRRRRRRMIVSQNAIAFRCSGGGLWHRKNKRFCGEMFVLPWRTIAFRSCAGGGGGRRHRHRRLGGLLRRKVVIA